MTQQGTNQDNEQIVTSVRLTRDEHARFRALAISQHRTMSGQLRLLIERELEQEAA